MSLQWRHNERDSVLNHQPHDCLLNRLFRRKSKKTSKLRVTGLWEEKWPVTSDFPAQRASNAENVSIWWRHHVLTCVLHMSISCDIWYRLILGHVITKCESEDLIKSKPCFLLRLTNRKSQSFYLILIKCDVMRVYETRWNVPFSQCSLTPSWSEFACNRSPAFDCKVWCRTNTWVPFKRLPP